MKYWKSKEYETEKKFQNAGFKAERIPLSRNVLEKSSEDVEVYDLGLLIDEKSTRGREFITLKKKDLYDIIETAERRDKIGSMIFSFFQDRKNKFIILTLKDFIKFAKKKETISSALFPDK